MPARRANPLGLNHLGGRNIVVGLGESLGQGSNVLGIELNLGVRKTLASVHASIAVPSNPGGGGGD